MMKSFNQFLYCFDKDLKKRLVEEGWRLLKTQKNHEGQDYFVFLATPENVYHFSFNTEDEKKYTFSNKLTF